MATPQPEQIQALILQTLDRDGTISDTRELELNGVKLASGDDQNAIKAVLDSLWSKEVSHWCAAAARSPSTVTSAQTN
jgi:hypothetical protein